MPISKQHLKPKAERKSKARIGVKTANTEQFERTEDILAQIICDIVNGLMRSDIINKLLEGIYENQPKAYKLPTAENYYQTAMQRIRQDRDDEIESLKAKLFSQYYNLYAEAMESNDKLLAKQVLDSIGKTFVPTDKDKANIQINKDLDKINISFGFDRSE